MNVDKWFAEIRSSKLLFVFFSTGVAIVELSFMWMVIPSTHHATNAQQESAIATLFGDNDTITMASDLSVVIENSFIATVQLNNNPTSWQRPLIHKSPCSRFGSEVATGPVVEKPSQTWIEHQHLLEVADRALSNLELSSIMTGKKALANINGRIYQQGGTLLPNSSEGAFIVKEVSTESVTLELIINDEQLQKEFGNIERVLFLTGHSIRNWTVMEHNK